jgi:hypothetical protein
LATVYLLIPPTAKQDHFNFSDKGSQQFNFFPSLKEGHFGGKMPAKKPFKEAIPSLFNFPLELNSLEDLGVP